MILSLIVAIAEDGAMGKNNGLPWYLPADLRFFKKSTMGKPVIMGRRTWESLGRPLPGRLNVVLSSLEMDLPQDVLLYHELKDAIARVAQEGLDEAFIIGGSKLFAESLPQLQRLYITRIQTTVPDADTFFPEIDYSDWKLSWEEKHEADETNKFNYAFQLWERSQPS